MMSIKYVDMFNGEIKKKFIEDNYNTDASKKVIANTFYKTQLSEMILNKDLYDFTLDELLGAMVSLQLTTYNSVKNAASLFKTYIDWSYKNSYRISNLNLMDAVSEHWIKSAIDRTEQSFWSKSEIYNIVDSLIDYQDKVLVLGLFEGIYGKKLSEMVNLKLEDVNEDEKTVKLYDFDGSHRVITISEKLINFIKIANENASYTGVDGITHPVNDSPYVIRAALSSARIKVTSDPVTQLYALRRLSNIGEHFNFPKFKANNINRSGILSCYNEAILTKNNNNVDYNYPCSIEDLTNKELEDCIAHRFNWTLQTHILGYRFYNTSTYKKGFINLDVLCEVYR